MRCGMDVDGDVDVDGDAPYKRPWTVTTFTFHCKCVSDVVCCICMFMYRGMYGFMPGLPCIPQKVNASTRMHLKRNVKVFNQWKWKASAHRPGQQLYQYSSPSPIPSSWSLSLCVWAGPGIIFVYLVKIFYSH